MNLKNLQVFTEIVDGGSMTSAAKSMNMSTTAVSQRLAALEDHYGSALLRRSTRSLSLTDEGLILLEGARKLLAEEQELRTSISLGQSQLAGTIHFSAPIDIGKKLVVPMVDRFMDRNPDVKIEILLTESHADFVKENLDFAISNSRNESPNILSVPLVPNQQTLLASPEYLARQGTPQHPKELKQHDCLVLRIDAFTERFWSFQLDGKTQKFPVSGTRISNVEDVIMRWCLAGKGIAVKSNLFVLEHVENGTLVPVLQNFAAKPTEFRLEYQSTKQLPQRVTKLIDFLRSEFEKL